MVNRDSIGYSSGRFLGRVTLVALAYLLGKNTVRNQ